MKEAIMIKKDKLQDSLKRYVVAETENSAYLVTPDIDSIPVDVKRFLISKEEKEKIEKHLIANIDIIKRNELYAVKINRQYKFNPKNY